MCLHSQPVCSKFQCTPCSQLKRIRGFKGSRIRVSFYIALNLVFHLTPWPLEPLNLLVVRPLSDKLRHTHRRGCTLWEPSFFCAQTSPPTDRHLHIACTLCIHPHRLCRHGFPGGWLPPGRLRRTDRTDYRDGSDNRRVRGNGLRFAGPL